MLQQILPYQSDSTHLFQRIAHEDWAVMLDSGQPMGQYGRYDIICGRPFVTIVTRNGKATVNLSLIHI